jgi:hypothetical protein
MVSDIAPGQWLPLVDAFRIFCRLPGIEGKKLFAEVASLPALAA